MTLAVAWERRTGQGSELLFASDSRVRQGGAWDTCPKIFRLPRTDALMAFAGETLWAYPIALQTIATIQDFAASRSGHYDLRATRGHAMRTMNGMMQSAPSDIQGQEFSFEFLFGGWCWQEQAFRLWRLYWAPYYGEMRHDSVQPTHRLGKSRFIGTRDSGKNNPADEVVGAAKALLSRRLRDRYGILRRGQRLDMEPWEVLLEIIRSGTYDTVGGAPQLAKVYRSMNSTVFSVLWPDRNGKPTLLGRQLLDYEVTDAPQIDPDGLHDALATNEQAPETAT